METEHGKIDGNLSVNYEFVLHGTVTENIVVEKGGFLYLHGVCGKNLIIQEGGQAYLYGTVSGDVQNLGGYLEVYGVINGRLTTNDNGNSIVDKDAVIRK